MLNNRMEQHSAGVLPAWLSVQLSDVAAINSETLGLGTPGDYAFRYIDISSVKGGRIDWAGVQRLRFRGAPSRARRIVRPNDVLLCTVRPSLQAHAFADWRAIDGFICSTGFAVVRAQDDLNPRFLFHLLFSSEIAEQLRRLEIGSGYPAVNERDIRTLTISLPPFPEQRRITEVLDTADEAIRHTEGLIAKLKQMKQGLLHDLLTRGLDENGEMRDPVAYPKQFKDSPLGQIPNAWEIRTADSLCEEIVVGIVIKPTQYYTDSGVPVLRSANIRETGLDLSQLVYMSERSNQMLAKSRIAAGDVVTVRTGYPGTSCVIPATFRGGNCVDVIISRPGPQLDSNYFALWINSEFGKGQVLRVQGGLAQQHFNTGDLKRLLVATPPHSEQVRIRQAAEAASARIRAEEAYRDKLQLLKKGLMQDLLTGRVRVPVPEPEPELIEAGA